MPEQLHIPVIVFAATALVLWAGCVGRSLFLPQSIRRSSDQPLRKSPMKTLSKTLCVVVFAALLAGIVAPRIEHGRRVKAHRFGQLA